MSADQKRQLFDNIAAAMQGVLELVQLRQIEHFSTADPPVAAAERSGWA